MAENASDEDCVVGGFNYQVENVPRSIISGGKVYVNRMTSGSDGDVVGMKSETVEHKVWNGRKLNPPMTLDANSFTLVDDKCPEEVDFLHEDDILHKYYPACCELLKQKTGAVKVYAFDHNVRSSRVNSWMNKKEEKEEAKEAKEEEEKKAIKGGGPIQSVANIVHGDYSLVSAPKRLQLLCEPPKVNDTYKKLYGDRPLIPADDMQALKDKRYCIINVWRNINSYPVMELPLAMCDGATVPLDDLVTFEVRYQDRTGENYLAYPSKPPPGKEGAHHRWVYYPGMVKDEAILLKCWDSKGSDFAGLDPETGKPAINATPESGPYRATMALHTAFQDPSSPPDALSRESIEVRCIAFYD